MLHVGGRSEMLPSWVQDETVRSVMKALLAEPNTGHNEEGLVYINSVERTFAKCLGPNILADEIHLEQVILMIGRHCGSRLDEPIILTGGCASMPGNVHSPHKPSSARFPLSVISYRRR